MTAIAGLFLAFAILLVLIDIGTAIKATAHHLARLADVEDRREARVEELTTGVLRP